MGSCVGGAFIRAKAGSVTCPSAQKPGQPAATAGKHPTDRLRSINQHAKTLHPDPAKPWPELSQAWQPAERPPEMPFLLIAVMPSHPRAAIIFLFGAQSPEPGQALHFISSTAGPLSPLPTRQKHRRASPREKQVTVLSFQHPTPPVSTTRKPPYTVP